MSLPSQKTSGSIGLSELWMILFGPPKIGKTTLMSGFPDTLILATEVGYKALKVYAKNIKIWEDFQDTVDEIVKGKHKFKTIGIDTADLLFTLCLDYTCNKLDIDHVSDEKWGKGYDMAAKEFEIELNKLFLSPYGLIFTSHTKDVDIVTRGGKITKTVPTLPNQARRVLLPKVSVIGFMGIKSVKGADKVFREQRYISFSPSEFLEAGDRDGKLPTEIISYKDPSKTYQQFYSAYHKK
jgi:hypothetical protein